MSASKKMLELRIQKVEPDSASGRLITFIKEGMFNGVAISPSSLALQILSMCLQPYADEKVLSDLERQKRTAVCVQLLLLHCHNLCNWAGLDLADFWSKGKGLVVESDGKNELPKSKTSLAEVDKENSLEEEDILSYSLENSDYEELGFD